MSYNNQELKENNKESTGKFTGRKPSQDLSPKEKIDLTIKHFKYLLEIKPEKQAVLEMRTHAAWYIKGLNKSKEIKLEIFKCETKEELLKILVEYKKIL